MILMKMNEDVVWIELVRDRVIYLMVFVCRFWFRNGWDLF